MKYGRHSRKTPLTMRITAALFELFDQAERSWLVAAVLSIITVVVLVTLIGPSPIMSPWDVFTLLAGGWRIFNGQAPNTDFHNPIGPLVYWLTAIGMHIAGPSLRAYVYGNLIFLAVVAPWAALVFFRKLPGPSAFLLTFFIAVLVTAPHPLGYDASRTTYAMIYNRYGWALTSVLFIQLLVPDRTVQPRAERFDAISSGFLLGLIFVCKINFFVFGVAALVLSCVLRAGLRQWVWWVPIGFTIVCFGAWMACGINPIDYLSDIALAGRVQSIDMRIAWLKGAIKANVLQGLVMSAIWVSLIGWPYVRGRASLLYTIRTSVVWAFALFSAMVITAGNAPEDNDVPLFLVAGIILLDAWRRQNLSSEVTSIGSAAWAYYMASIAVVLLFFGGIFVRDAMSFAHAYAGREYRISEAPPSQRFDSPRLQDFVIPHTSNWQTAYSRARDVPARINEGLLLLQRHVSSQSKVLTLAYTDPFSFAMGLRPPTGTPLWWDLGFSFNLANYPAPEHVFSGANFVIYPLLQRGAPGCCQETAHALLDLYGDFLKEHFDEVGRSLHWALLKRRPTGI